MGLSDLLLVILSVFFTYRGAEFIVYDDAPAGVMKRTRTLVGIKAAGSKQYGFWWSVAEVINCPFCVGVWIALPLAVSINPFVEWKTVLLWGAIAGGQAWLESMSQSR